MEPVAVILTFVAMASGLAVLRVIAEHKQMARAARPVRRRSRPAGEIALTRLRDAADALRDLR